MRVPTYLSGEESGTTLGDLEDDGAVLVTSGLERRNDGGRGGHVLGDELVVTVLGLDRGPGS